MTTSPTIYLALRSAAEWLFSARGFSGAHLVHKLLPPGHEFLSIWCFSSIGSDSMIGIWQCGIYVYFATACFVLCRVCGCGRSSTLLALSLAAVTPTLLAHILTTYSDIFAAGVFASALAFAVIAGRDPRRIHLLGLALSCGALLAAKLPTPVLIVAALAVFAAQHAIHRIAFGRFARSIVFVLLVALALGGYWYLRNYLLYGNPFYPFRMHFAGLTLDTDSTRRPRSWSTQRPNGQCLLHQSRLPPVDYDRRKVRMHHATRETPRSDFEDSWKLPGI